MELINVGIIVGFHGLKGELKVKTTTDFIKERFKKNNVLLLNYQDDLIEMKIASVREHKGLLLITFEGYSHLNDVEKFKGYKLQITKEMLLALENDEYYYFDLIGLEVITYTKESLGKVKSIMETGANDILVVETSDKEILIPFINAVVDEVNLNAKQITLHEIEGLW
ncbi:ribosome maturation factor RimM [Erysipelotrichaceae bacterium OttesenSCG-928-M19]|nr:ribosome maturation factor RimM [Erysipelotrichaceae bacterium OttesenSCG-928-M19]